MNIYKQFATNKESEAQGVWVDLGGKTDPSFKIARMGSSNSAYVKALEKVTRRYKTALKVGALSNEKAVIFNRENALKVMNELPDLYDFLRDQANESSTFKEYLKEEDSKN